MRTKLTADSYRSFFNKKLCFGGKDCGFFGLFPWDKRDYIDVWMIKITIKTNQIYKDAFFFQNVSITYKNYVCLQILPISINLLVFKFNPFRQTWYQKFLGTYPPLAGWRAKTGKHSNIVL